MIIYKYMSHKWVLAILASLGLAGKDNCESAWCDIFVETLQELRLEGYKFYFSKETDQAVKVLPFILLNTSDEFPSQPYMT